MARKKTADIIEPTPFDGINSGLPACVVAANAQVQTDEPPTASPKRRATAAPVVTGRREYTREDFAAASGGAWVSGFVCKKCGCQDMRVHRTSRRPDCSAVVRTRICRNCGEKVNTVEQ